MTDTPMKDMGQRLTDIGMTMADYFAMDDAEDRNELAKRLRKAADMPKNVRHRQTLLEIAKELDEDEC